MARRGPAGQGRLPAGHGQRPSRECHTPHDVSFDVRQGEILSMPGRNRAGKTAPLKALIGKAPASSAAVALDGEVIADLPSATIAWAGWAAFHRTGAFAGMAVRDGLEPGRIRRRTGKRHASGRRDPSTLSAACRADGHRGRPPVVERAADGRRGPRPVGRHPHPAAGRAVRPACPCRGRAAFRTFVRLSIVIMDRNLALRLRRLTVRCALHRGRAFHEGPSRASAGEA